MDRQIVPLFQDEAELKQFVKTCDARLDERMERMLDAFEHDSEAKLFGLTGPTCSGKTTAAQKMTDGLQKKGLHVHVISIDDFYFDKEYLNRISGESGNEAIDYDSERTIDIALLAEKTESLLCGRETQLPHFDFSIGKRTVGKTILPHREDVFLFEGIQILYPRVAEILNRSHTYRCLYICPQSAIEAGESIFFPHEIRLCRRLVRDFYRRATAPDFTLYLWKTVRSNEEANIFPHVRTCHGSIDSTLTYEMGMLKPYLEPLLQQAAQTQSCSKEATELLHKLQPVSPIPVSYLTEHSLYKEFIS